MAEPLKTRGLEELQSLLQRTRRQLALKRIYQSDAAYIEERLQEVEARIISMPEKDKTGEEVE